MVNNIPNGGIDAKARVFIRFGSMRPAVRGKVSSACLMKRMACQALCGKAEQALPSDL